MHGRGGHGLLGVDDPEGVGRRAAATTSATRCAIEAVAQASATVAVSLSVTNSLVAELIAHAGRDQQRERWLRPLASGAAIGAFALSEPDAGTDAANQQTTAVQAGDGYRITGRKVWVANAEEASVAIVFACTRPGLRGQGVTAFLVPDGHAGVTRTARADSLGVRGLGCMDLDLDITVGDDQVLGHGRSGLPAGDVGAAGRPRRDRRRRRSASARRRSTRRSPTRSSASSSASRSPTIRRSSGCSPTWRPSSTAARMLTLKAAAAKDRQEKSDGRGVDGEARRVRGRRTRPPTRRCRSSRRPAIAAGRSSSGCSATCARRKSTRARPEAQAHDHRRQHSVDGVASPDRRVASFGGLPRVQPRSCLSNGLRDVVEASPRPPLPVGPLSRARLCRRLLETRDVEL